MEGSYTQDIKRKKQLPFFVYNHVFTIYMKDKCAADEEDTTETQLSTRDSFFFFIRIIFCVAFSFYTTVLHVLFLHSQ